MTDAPTKQSPLPQGATIGILGGGQLGRMIAVDAARLGYRCHIFAQTDGGPANQVSSDETVASFTDDASVRAFAKRVDVVTVETEHIPPRTLEIVEKHGVLRPSARSIEICQDREIEKTFINDAGVMTTRWEALPRGADILQRAPRFGLPCIVKTSTGGYDGHGQRFLRSLDDVRAAASEFAERRVILEAVVDYEFEASVIVARGTDGSIESYPPVRNEHRDHILWQTHAPANISPIIDRACRDAATIVAESLEIIGLVAVEFFICSDDEVLVNELAPRPHNSGHWSMDGAQTPQFEQLVRAIAGLPLGSTRVLHPVRMTNLLGTDVLEREKWCSNAQARIHLYGKDEIRPGRKMGHVNELFID